MAEQEPHKGRPRQPRLDTALLAAGLEVFLERGYHGASLAEIARRAGVGTPAIYRRWPTKADFGMDVVAHIGQPDPIPDTGAIRSDLAEFLRLRLRTWSTPMFHQLLLPLVLEAWADPKLTQDVRDRFIAYRGPNLKPRIVRAVAAGQLRPDTDPDRLVDVLMGTVVMPLLFSQDMPKESEASSIVDKVLDGFAPRDHDDR